jgi:predicted CoA-binding protein
VAGPLTTDCVAQACGDGSDSRLARILRETRAIAVVGASADPMRPSYRIMAYLQRQGYVVFPVNPRAGVAAILGAPVATSLAALRAPTDLVAVFRNPEAVFAVATDAISQQARLLIRTLWMQSGIRNEAAARLAEAAGIAVVMDRCLMVEHTRLLHGRDR